MKPAEQLDYSTIDGWCAGCKVDAFGDYLDFKNLKQSDIEALVVDETACAVVVISVTLKEKKAIEWLRENGYEETRFFSNYKSGNKTALFLKTISKRKYDQVYKNGLPKHLRDW